MYNLIRYLPNCTQNFIPNFVKEKHRAKKNKEIETLLKEISLLNTKGSFSTAKISTIKDMNNLSNFSQIIRL